MKKNTYESTEVTYDGGVEYGSDIHAVAIRSNKIVWDMIKILDKNMLFGFHFKTELAKYRTIIVMTHLDEDMIDKAKHLLTDFNNIPDVLFLAKVKKKKSSNRALKIALGFSILALILFGLFEVFFFNSYITFL